MDLPRVVALLGVACACACEKTPAVEPVRDVASLPDGPTAASDSGKAPPEAFVLRQGTVGGLGPLSVGVGDVYGDGVRAGITISNHGPVHWESSLLVRSGSLVPAQGQVFRVSVFGGSPGTVLFGPPPAGASLGVPSDGIVLTEEGFLVDRNDGKDIEKSTHVAIDGWDPDKKHPRAATVAWWPGGFARENTDPKIVRSLRLEAGARLDLPDASFAVVAVEGETPEHSPWVVLRMQ